MKQKMRLMVLILGAVLVLGALAPAALAAPVEIPYEELVRGRINIAEFDALVAQIRMLAQDEKNAQAVQEKLMQIDDWLLTAVTWYTFDMIEYYQNVQSEQTLAAYRESSEAYSACSQKWFDCLRELLGTPCGDAVRAMLTHEDLEDLLSGDSGRTVSVNVITDRYTEAYETAFAELYASETEQIEAIGTLYLELIAELKAELGSGEEVVRLYYEMYGRTGTYADYAPMRQVVREKIAPLMMDMWVLADGADAGPQSGEEALAAIVAIACEAFPELAEAAEYMQTYGYYDVTPGEEKFSGGFTTYLYLYEAPFLYLPTEGGVDAVAGISHELGHFCDFYTYGGTTDLDSSEVHSQGLELLYTLYYDELFGEQADEAELYELSNMLWSVVFGCLIDEFQYEAIVNTPQTPAELQALYLSLLDDYGLELLTMFQGAASYWTYISHNFNSPMYYLSYAVSALPSLELWSVAQSDPDAAKASYAEFCRVSNETLFENALLVAGLSDPSEGGSTARLAVELGELVQASELWAFADIASCWGATEIQLAWLLGAVNGCGDGLYRPDETLTRAQAATVLYNLFGEEPETEPETIADVPAGHWAADAIDYALAVGALSLGTDERFRPDEAITREEMAVLLYSVLQSGGYVATEAGVPYTDEDQITGECAAAVQALYELGVMEGYPDGTFGPNDALSRQELAIVICRLVISLDSI